MGDGAKRTRMASVAGLRGEGACAVAAAWRRGGAREEEIWARSAAQANPSQELAKQPARAAQGPACAASARGGRVP